MMVVLLFLSPVLLFLFLFLSLLLVLSLVPPLAVYFYYILSILFSGIYYTTSATPTTATTGHPMRP